MRARWWAEGAGLALVVMLPSFFPLLLPDNLALYHEKFPVQNLIFGILLDLGAIAVLSVCALALVLRLPERPRLMAGAVLAAAVLWRAGLFLASLRMADQFDLLAHGERNASGLIQFLEEGMRLKIYVAAGLVLIFLLLALAKPLLMRAIIRGTRIGLAGFAFSIIWLVPQLVYLTTRSAQPRVSARQISPSRVKTSSTPQARLVWILFDELSYRVVFEQHPAGEEFPNLESLHNQSFSFTRVDPVGFYTDHVVPSLLAGKEMDEIRSTSAGRLEYRGLPQRNWEAFDEDSSLFGVAERSGWNPGVAGWYNPYCRLFASVLSECSWRAAAVLPLETIGASGSKSIAANALILPEQLLARLSGERLIDGSTGRQRNIDDYRSIMERARGLIQNQQIHFVFLHLPVPHPPGIYDRRRHQLRPAGNYLDNLTLADDTLGQLMHEIAESADSDQTTVIVSSDHSWRVPMWETGRDWTQEEEEISHGKFDPRPVFLVHFPGQTNSVEVRSQVPELEEHDIIAAIFSRQVGNEAQLAALLGAEKITVAGYQDQRPEAGQ